MTFKTPTPCKTNEMEFNITIQLFQSSYTEQEAFDKIQYLINSSNSKVISEFIVFLLRETRSNSYEIKDIQLKEIK